ITRGHLLCCLCKKWANYKDLGDLYGPYYPPDYLTKLPKNPPVTRQSQGTVRLSSPEANLGSITLTNQQSQTEDSQKRPQHRKLTSHPRFKRRHKSNEDLRKTGPTNNKALLPFQPPPPLQLLKQGASDLSAALAVLPQVPLDPEELWVHESCIVWASGVFLVNGRLYGLQEALDGARDMCCSYCEMVGSTLGCYSKGCTLRYHYLCAIEDVYKCPCLDTNKCAKSETRMGENEENGILF
uniref:PHD-type domain-containing protein n=1 Tax=Paramormyrops kingsleyae TaxID=1676925 RepID=A0A3B3RDR6_9TELE